MSTVEAVEAHRNCGGNLVGRLDPLNPEHTQQGNYVKDRRLFNLRLSHSFTLFSERRFFPVLMNISKIEGRWSY